MLRNILQKKYLDKTGVLCYNHTIEYLKKAFFSKKLTPLQ